MAKPKCKAEYLKTEGCLYCNVKNRRHVGEIWRDWQMRIQNQQPRANSISSEERDGLDIEKYPKITEKILKRAKEVQRN